MEFTFGIITTNKTDLYMNRIIESIKLLKIPNYEIIVVGGDNNYSNDVIHIEFDESIKPAWITRKKNLITNNSTKENIVFLHDYCYPSSDWFEGYLKIGNDFDVSISKVVDLYNRRYSDYVSWDHPIVERYHPFDYSDQTLIKNCYFPGCYFVAKRDVMIKYPLNENLTWGQSEDIEWSLRVRNLNNKFNKYSTIKHSKKHRGFNEEKSYFDSL
jgi:hypothetical protein